MKQFLFYILVLLGPITSFKQKDSITVILEDAIKSRLNVDKIVYLDSSISFYQPFSHFVRKRKVEGYNGIAKVSMVISKDEIKYLDKAFSINQRVAWKESMFSNSIRIPFDSLLIFSQKDKGSAYFEQHFAKKYFLFSNPVFFRNNSIAVFRLAEMIHPSAGYDYLYFYTKSGEQWIHKMTIQSGAW